jgi:hypothetical protein
MINLHTWFSEREMNFCPKHFVRCQTPLTDERKNWVIEKLVGRFYINQRFDGMYDLFEHGLQIYFEDPQEAVQYELVWS